MSYCVNCGVELSDELKKCPLCDTEVVHPGKAPSVRDCTPYPVHSPGEQAMQRNGIAFILSLLVLIPAAISFICDLGINQAVSWSGYVMGACAMLYIFCVPPFLLPRLSPVWFVAMDGAGLCAYLFLIERMSHGTWALPFGMPVVAGLAVLIIVIMVLAMHTKLNPLHIVAASLAGVGGYAVWIEFLINLAFHVQTRFVWSLYPLSTCIILAAVLVVIEHNGPLKEKLRRKFFL